MIIINKPMRPFVIFGHLMGIYFSILLSPLGISQVYYAYSSESNPHLYEIILNETNCSCSYNSIGNPPEVGFHVTFSPNNQLYAISQGGIYLYDFGADDFSLAYPISTNPSEVFFAGLVCVNDSLFYTSLLDLDDSEQRLYRYNKNSGSFTYLGQLPLNFGGDMTLFNGSIYAATVGGYILIDTLNPSNSYLAVPTLPEFIGAFGVTASPYCNLLLGVDISLDSIYYINTIDGTVTPACAFPIGLWWITSMEEFNTPECVVSLDLDCNDSSGASGSDFNSPDFDCVSPGVGIADVDINIMIDDPIDQMTIQIAGSVPDDPFEILDMTGGVPGINTTGLGTDMLTLTNAGGASVRDFKDALRMVTYRDVAFYPTGGPRTVEVQFTTTSGMMSNVATAFIEVNELDQIIVDIGPDLQICENEFAIFNAGHPGSWYQWSSGQSTQSVSVNQSGQYIVTVSNGVICPGRDTAVLVVVPVIDVSISGIVEICDNEPANLQITTNTPYSLTITISAEPGSPFIFDDITGNYGFIDLPVEETTYTITSVVPSQEACIVISDPEHTVSVFPTYNNAVDVAICDGDSTWLGFYWETEAGVYENNFNALNGCDSVVTTTITILPSVQIAQQSTTCDPSAAGVFITHLDNPSGCDTVVTTTVTLLPSDTTLISLSTCVWTQAGITTDTFNNQDGCDSLVITTTDYLPPSDTTFLYASSCDSTALGVRQDTLTGLDGCDSLVVLTTSFALVDTTHLAGTSCIASEIGVFDSLYTDALGCDSLVITTVTPGLPDTTHLYQTSCDSSDLGESQDILTGKDGCDSLIITTVTFSAQDSTFISSSTCDPSAAGIFVTSLINQFGCDSIVTETVSLLPSDVTSLSSNTCDPSTAGVFMQMLINQYGCDSIVTETVTLLPSDQTSLVLTTCIASQAGVFVTTLTNQYGCDSVITETITLIPGDTTVIQLFTCDPAETGVSQHASTGSDGCDSLAIETTILYPLPVLQVQSAIDYNGFDISCAGDVDGSAIANVSGVPPYTYLWSTSDTDQLITGLSAGAYAVSITDGNGCTTDGVITLSEPDLFIIGFEVSEPDCFDQQLGSIIVKPSGGVAPYTYSIDGTLFQTSPDFTGLSEGIYQITSLDANDCSATEIISIDVPLMVQVELGDNQVISIGDSAHLQAIINLPFDSLSSIIWTGIDSIDCPNCLTQIVAPIITTAYSVSVTSVDGCADRDSLTVSVSTDQQIYVPNIFSPNGDGINDVLSISIRDGVEEISSFVLFDRWGNMVFLAEHVLSAGPTISWDGKMNGETMNPGVFTYKLVAQLKDGERFVKYGDITLLR